MSRITTETMTFGILALLFGLGGAYLVKLYLQPREEAPVAQPPQVTTFEVPVASLNLSPGRTIALGDMAIRRMTRDEMLDLNWDLDRTMLNSQQIIGRVLRDPIKLGDPFLTDQLYPQGGRPSLTERLAPGQRAYTVRIEPDAAVAGFAGPGAVVDVLFRTNSSFDRQGGPFPDRTMTLLEGIEVLALGPYMTPGEAINEPVDTVTLAVTPEQVTRLKIVENRGTLSLAMRDASSAAAVGASRERRESTLAEVLGIRPSQPAYWVTEIYVRGQMSNRVFPGDTGDELSQNFDASSLLPFDAPPTRAGATRPRATTP